MSYTAGRETVGIFRDAQSFQDAVDDLLLHGFDRSLLSLEAGEAAVERAIGHPESSGAAADDPAVPRIPFLGMRSRSTMRAMAISVLASIAVCAAIAGVIKSGGTVALAFAVAAAVAVGGLALGLILALVERRRHARYLAWQIGCGGILLWVTGPTPEQEAQAEQILRQHQAENVHSRDVPAGRIPSTGGVSETFAWIDKPLRWLLPRGDSARSERRSTVH